MGISLAAARLIATPFFTIFAVLSLATGVAVTTAVYSVVDALFLRELGVREPSRVAVVVPSYDRGSGRVLISEPDFRDLRAAQRSFASLSATAVFYPAVSSSVTTEVLAAEAVDGVYFSTLGVDAALGRVLQPADEDGARHVAVVSHALWRLRFASDPAIVGHVIRIGGQPFEIVGVAPRSYAGVIGGLDVTRLWIPLAAEARLPASTTADAVNSRERRRLQVFGRLAPATTVSAASAEVASIGARLEAAFPRKSQAGAVGLSERTWGAKTVADISEANDGTRRFGWTVIVLVSLVLVVACTNLANLMLARGTSRQKELAVRAALGASRWRLVREQCVESFLLAGGGAVAAYVVFQLLQAWMSVDFNLMGRWTMSIRPTLDPAAVAVAGVALLLSLVIFGLEPALHLVRAVNITGAIAAAKGRRRTLRQRMVIRWQVAVSAGFFIIATMFVRQTLALARHDPGIELDRIAVAVLNIQHPLWDEARLGRTLDRVMEEGRKDPFIASLSVSTGLPFGLPALQVYLSKPAEVPTKTSARPGTAIAATSSIFATLGVRIVRGRAFDDRDDAAAAPVVVVSEHTARRIFGSVDAVGQQLVLQRRSKEPQTATVIGVAGDTDVRAIRAEPGPVVYLPLAQHYESALTVAVRSTQDANRAVPALRATLRRADPDLAVEVIGTGHAVLSGVFEILRAGGMATLYLGGLTLALAMVGLFGVQSHLIAHRTQEIGVRMSMGATARQIKAMVLLDGYRPVVEGLVLGLWGGFAGRVIVRAYMEIDVNIFDPWMLVATPIPVVAAAFCACYMPARRAARVDPTVALRCE